MALRHVRVIETIHCHRNFNFSSFFFPSRSKYAPQLFDDSSNFDGNNLQSTASTEIPSTSCESSNSKFQWPSKKNQSIPPSSFYNKTDCDTTTRIEKSLENPAATDLYRKSRSTLMDAVDREHYANELAKMNSKPTGGSSLLSALDEDYGVRNVDQKKVDDETIQPNQQLDCNVAGIETPISPCDRTTESEDKLVENEQSNEDSEDVIPCTPPPEKTLKRKAGLNTKQKKITDMYPKLDIKP